MGADFISYCVFGPKTLSKSKTTMRRAEKKMTDVVGLALKILELENQASEQPDSDAAKELTHIWTQLVPHGMGAEDIVWAAQYEDNPMKLVDELFDIWHGGSRDSSSRVIPGDKRRKVWFAGEMTWGDEPDGFGYQTMKRADMAGLLDVFGIE